MIGGTVADERSETPNGRPPGLLVRSSSERVPYALVALVAYVRISHLKTDLLRTLISPH